MTTKTDIANRALAFLGESAILDIADTTTKHSRLCNQLIDPAIDETLRLHRWNCATARATLSATDAPNHGFAYAYQLPGDFLRLLELNGEAFTGSEEYLEIEEGQRLLSNSATAEIRYIKRIDPSGFDPLLAKVVALQLAMDLAVPLTANLQLQGQVASLYARAMGKAAKTDAVETGSREGRTMARLLQNSPLIRSRGRRRGYDPERFILPD